VVHNRDKPLDIDAECTRYDCTRKQYKLAKNASPTYGLCKRHYYQMGHTDPALEKIKKYWILVAIAVVIIGAINFIDDPITENIPVSENSNKSYSFSVDAYDVWPDNYRKWDRNLSWDDFEIVNSIEEQPDHAAQIAVQLIPWYKVNVTISTECNIEFLDTNTTAIMHKDRSSRVDYFFTNASDSILETSLGTVYSHPDYSLKHEQGHYDIAEIAARTLANSLKLLEGNSFSCDILPGTITNDDVRNRVLEIIQPFEQKIDNQLGEKEKLYDELTANGGLEDEQYLMYDDIEKELKRLEFLLK